MKYTYKDLQPVVGIASEERETITRSDDSGKMTIYTCENPMITKLRKLCESNPENYAVKRVDKLNGQLTGYVVTAPRELLTLRAPREGRELTEEQRAVLAERLAKVRRSKKV
jgi:hypothetical protein